MESHRYGAVRPVFQPRQSGAAGRGPVAFHRGLPCQIVPQAVMIVQVLVTQGQAIDPLANHGKLAVIATGLTAGILQTFGGRGRQTQKPIRLPQQQDPRIARHVAAPERGFYPPPFTPWK